MLDRRCLINDLIFFYDGEVEEHCHDNEGNNGVKNFNWNVVLGLLRKFTFTGVSSMKNSWPENQNQCEDSNYSGSNP